MRKITKLAVDAFLVGEPFQRGNTCVTVDDGTVLLSLHGNAIAKREGDELFVRTCGYDTVTTKERLNGLPGVQVWHHKKVLHLNGEPWWDDDGWTQIACRHCGNTELWCTWVTRDVETGRLFCSERCHSEWVSQACKGAATGTRRTSR